MSKEQFLAQARAYGKERWCWDDASFFEELYIDHGTEGLEPAAWIDLWAEHYDLDDPRTYLWG